MSRSDLATVFGLNIYPDVKWCIYNAYWKHISPINNETKKELLDLSRLFALLNEYKRTYEGIYHNFDEREIEGTFFRSYNRTNYLDAIIYDISVYSTLNNRNCTFSYICKMNIDTVIDDVYTMVFTIQSNIEGRKSKLDYIHRLWNSLEPDIKTFIEKNISVLDIEDIVDIDNMTVR